MGAELVSSMSADVPRAGPAARRVPGDTSGYALRGTRRRADVRNESFTASHASNEAFPALPAEAPPRGPGAVCRAPARPG
ncbi:hypothetical protein GCM10017567_70050 [Amycolatopsis bullii]|uniref:Uncharacterized protein n=1 Tax=Amycolatopsis bullii TaxID=941987 RepID=A0ABQ3KNK5_9PSEU|nr:hypothetical protein GCM10017567_70050 [Amycolatopsis bullii]